jgi:polyhydroxyalkanoate synthesis regulator phasin
MLEKLDKILVASLGAVSMTRERAEKIFDEYVARGEAERGNKSGFVKELMDHAEKARRDMEKMIGDQVHAAISKLDLATKADIERIEKKIAEHSAQHESSKTKSKR